jgi:hypothetical protein
MARTEEERKAANRAAQAKFRATRKAEQIDADKANRRKIQQDLRDRRKADGLRNLSVFVTERQSRTIKAFLEADLDAQVMEFIESFKNKGETK